MCHGKTEFSHISQDEMRTIMKAAVDRLYTFLNLKEQKPKKYAELLTLGEKFTIAWDEPHLIRSF